MGLSDVGGSVQGLKRSFYFILNRMGWKSWGGRLAE